MGPQDLVITQNDEFRHLPIWGKVEAKWFGREEKESLIKAVTVMSNRFAHHREGFFSLTKGAIKYIMERRMEGENSSQQPITRGQAYRRTNRRIAFDLTREELCIYMKLAHNFLGKLGVHINRASDKTK